jgi:alkylation response protein AidB-like acyl-CoA dehydrogenase
VSLDLDFDAGQLAVAGAVEAFCKEHPAAPDTEAFPHDAWRALAELGVLALATPAGDGGPLELVAAFESLGRAVFPGPLAASVLAARLLEGAERERVIAGQALVSVGAPPLLPFAPLAEIFIEIHGGGAWLARPRGAVVPVSTLGGEPWGRLELERVRALGDGDAALTLYDTALAAYLAGAAEGLVTDAAEHARTRRQFGRAIGEFQAVAHPLADCITGVAAARTLARSAASRLERGEVARAGPLAATARLSAVRWGLRSLRVCHQVFGAIGITLEGPAFRISRRIRQLASQPPGLERTRERALDRLGLAEGRAE